jgi:GT2 family glycosyltransferase
MTASCTPPPPLLRPRVRGKFLYAGDEKLWVRGVTYGTFRPDGDGGEYGARARVQRDFAQVAAGGFNAVRTYTVPPRWLLDEAAAHGLRVMVGLPWEQHVTFLDDPARARAIEQAVRAGVGACAGHPAVLAYAIGNEIPAPVIRWHGRRAIERYLGRLYRAAKAEDRDALVTYVSYPTTEYLDLPFLDLLAFNVYLESRDRLEAYLARLQNLAGDRPLVMAELGLDSRRHGEQAQARVLDWQVRATFAAGCAGLFVFAWTDEWHRGGHEVVDWDFGLTRRDRRAKPALTTVRRALAEVPFAEDRPWPRISVVVCSYNGARTIRQCLDGLMRLDYPDYEVIVVNDGSDDATPEIAGQYGVRLINKRNHGLSHARNTGLAAATGAIVAYIDDDAYPDPHWLRYLAAAFLDSGHVGVGGPNVPPPEAGEVAQCVANAPGGPVHVLLSDREAEHIPGCNMAFRRSALTAIQGFDPQFRAAGDDVDVCWRLQERGGTLGFHPGALVWHHRRASVGAYWRQQRGYGRAEAMLERKWPEKYNRAGHLVWAGRLYGPGLARALGWGQSRVYQGPWGEAAFQRLYQGPPGALASLLLMPEWLLVIAALAALSVLGLLWPPLLAAVPALALAVGGAVVQAGFSAARARFADAGAPLVARVRRRALCFLLHLLQPLARLTGRLEHGLSPWRRRRPAGLAFPWVRTFAIWRERGQERAVTLSATSQALRAAGAVVRAGGAFDPWDLEVAVGATSAVRLLMVNEEHGAGRQLLRFRVWPRLSPAWAALGAAAAGLATGAALGRAWPVTVVLAGVAGLALSRAVADCSGALAAVGDVVPALSEAAPEEVSGWTERAQEVA